MNVCGVHHTAAACEAEAAPGAQPKTVTLCSVSQSSSNLVATRVTPPMGFMEPTERRTDDHLFKFFKIIQFL